MKLMLHISYPVHPHQSHCVTILPPDPAACHRFHHMSYHHCLLSSHLAWLLTGQWCHLVARHSPNLADAGWLCLYDVLQPANKTNVFVWVSFHVFLTNNRSTSCYVHVVMLCSVARMLCFQFLEWSVIWLLIKLEDQVFLLYIKTALYSELRVFALL